MEITGSQVLVSIPFWNVGNGVALPIGTWLRPQDDSTRVTGGASFGVVPPGQVARSRLSAGRDASWVEAAFEGQAGLIAGIQYTDLDGQQMSISEVEIRRQPSGEWRAGRTNLFRGDGSYPHSPYAFGGW
jgi:hypothetical protein